MVWHAKSDGPHDCIQVQWFTLPHLYQNLMLLNLYIASLKYDIFFLNDVMSQMLIIPETSYFGI